MRSPSCCATASSYALEDIFKTTKSILDTRPIYHKTDAAIRGHVFCSFLALVVRKALEDRLAAAGVKPEWGRLVMDLDRLQEIAMEQDGKHFIVRTPVTGDVGRVFQAVGLAVPRTMREAEAADPAAVIVPRPGRCGANDNVPMHKQLKTKGFVFEIVEEGPGASVGQPTATTGRPRVAEAGTSPVEPPTIKHHGATAARAATTASNADT